jgi:hypothetical protein
MTVEVPVVMVRVLVDDGRCASGRQLRTRWTTAFVDDNQRTNGGLTP